MAYPDYPSITPSFGNAGAGQRPEKHWKARPNKTYEKGRRCVSPVCDTILSIYNKTDHCAAHSTRLRLNV